MGALKIVTIALIVFVVALDARIGIPLLLVAGIGWTWGRFPRTFALLATIATILVVELVVALFFPPLGLVLAAATLLSPLVFAGMMSGSIAKRRRDALAIEARRPGLSHRN